MKFKKKVFVCALAVSACLICTNITANAQVPASGTIPTVEQTPAVEGSVTKTGTAINYSTLSVAEMNALVNKIGNKILTANSVETKVNFVLINEDVQNAYTDASDTVAVYSGLIKYCENEDELAFVIGHEIGHAVANHIIKGVVRDTAAEIGANVGKKAASNALTRSGFAGKFASYTGVDITSVASTGIDYTKAAGTSKMDRGQENDADELGLDYLVKAGYNPLAGISIMYKIGANYSDFWSDHPSTDKRIVSMYNYVQDKHPQFVEQGFSTSAYKEALSKYINNPY